VVDEEERSPLAGELPKARHVHLDADVEERVVILLEEVKLLAPGPGLEVQVGGHGQGRL
jgi:hypothetical protein